MRRASWARPTPRPPTGSADPAARLLSPACPRAAEGVAPGRTAPCAGPGRGRRSSGERGARRGSGARARRPQGPGWGSGGWKRAACGRSRGFGGGEAGPGASLRPVRPPACGAGAGGVTAGPTVPAADPADRPHRRAGRAFPRPARPFLNGGRTRILRPPAPRRGARAGGGNGENQAGRRGSPGSGRLGLAHPIATRCDVTLTLLHALRRFYTRRASGKPLDFPPRVSPLRAAGRLDPGVGMVAGSGHIRPGGRAARRALALCNTSSAAPAQGRNRKFASGRTGAPSR